MVLACSDRTPSHGLDVTARGDMSLTAPILPVVTVPALPISTTFTRHEPRPHQSEAVQALMARIGAGGRAQVIHPCGAGKTRTAAMFTDALDATTVLIALPSLNLVAQTMPEWHEQFGEDRVEYRAVCSDHNVTPRAHKYVGQGHVLSHADDIAMYLAAPSNGRVRLLFTTYQSSPKVADAVAVAADYGWRDFDLIVADEAHRLAGKHRRAYTTILHDDLIPSRRRLFLTATPKNAHHTRPSDTVVGMDNQFVFGPVAHKFSFHDATQAGILSPYKVTLLGITPADLTAINWDDPDDAEVRHQLGLVATLRTMHVTQARRLVTFHATKDRAERFADDLESLNSRRIPGAHVPDLHTLSVHSGDSPARRSSVMTLLGPDFAKPLVVSNPRVLTEGIDVPALDGVVFVDPRNSVVDTIQAIGRALRVAPGKKVGHIIIPVLMNPGDTAEEATTKGGFDLAWKVLSTLRDYDDSFNGWVDDTVANHALGNMPAGIEFDFEALAVPDAARLAQVAQLRMVNEIVSADTGRRVPEVITVLCDCCGRFPIDRIEI